METLREKQSHFVEMIGDLIREAKVQGYELTFGDAYRSNEQAAINALGASGRARLLQVLGTDTRLRAFREALLDNSAEQNGIARSLHTERLAVDFNIFRDGNLVSVNEITPLGEYWERLGGTWGGRFQDYGHFSLEHNGVK